jgi:hypothetical protein
MGATARRVGRLSRSPLLLAACVLLLLASQTAPVAASRALQPRARLLLEDDSASPAERVAVKAEAGVADEKADGKKPVAPVAPLPEEEVRGPELEAEIEEEIHEWEQEGGLISSVLVRVRTRFSPTTSALRLTSLAHFPTGVVRRTGGPSRAAGLPAAEDQLVGRRAPRERGAQRSRRGCQWWKHHTWRRQQDRWGEDRE